MPSYTPRFLLARLPTPQVPGFLRLLEATGVRLHPLDELYCAPHSTPGQSTLMAWMQCPLNMHERWERDKRVLSFRAGQPYA